MNVRLIIGLLLLPLFVLGDSDQNLPLALSQLGTLRENGSSEISFEPSFTFHVGTTNNVNLSQTHQRGSYAKISPSLVAEGSLGDFLFFTGKVDGGFKIFREKENRHLAQEKRAQAQTGVSWYLNDSWEMGGDLFVFYLENYLAGNTPSAILQSYLQPQGRFFLAWNGEGESIEVGLGTKRRHDRLPFTDLIGQEYKNSYDEYSLDGNVSFEWNKDVSLSGKSLWEQRFYRELRAEFTEGNPAPLSENHPLLRILTQEYEIQLNAHFSSITLTPSFGVGIEKDQIFGARDSFQAKIASKISAVLPLGLTFEPEISLARKSFKNFQVDPVTDSKGSPHRQDWIGRLTSSLRWALSSDDVAEIQYFFSERKSNDESQEYKEHAIEVGFVVKI